MSGRRRTSPQSAGRRFHSPSSGSKNRERQAAHKAAQAAAQAAERVSRVGSHLQQRPNQRALAKNNIVSGESVAPALASVAKKLKHEMIRNKVNEEFFSREEASVLVKQGVMMSNRIAPRLQSAKQKLEKNLTRDQLNHLLEARRGPEDLEQLNILSHGAKSRSSTIEGTRKRLERNMISDKVAHLLETRPELDDLAARSILKRTEVAPALQQKQNQLQKSLAKSNLFHALKYRPSIEELQERGVYPDGMPGQSEQSGSDFSDSEEFDEEYMEEYNNQYPLEEDPYQDSEDDEVYEEEEQQQQQEQQEQVYAGAPHRRSKNFHLTRILLKFVAGMGEAGEISAEQKGYLKDLIVDQDRTILAVAETFDAENDLGDFKDSLFRIAQRSA